jgi:hypothetical protein
MMIGYFINRLQTLAIMNVGRIRTTELSAMAKLTGSSVVQKKPRINA